MMRCRHISASIPAFHQILFLHSSCYHRFPRIPSRKESTAVEYLGPDSYSSSRKCGISQHHVFHHNSVALLTTASSLIGTLTYTNQSFDDYYTRTLEISSWSWKSLCEKPSVWAIWIISSRLLLWHSAVAFMDIRFLHFHAGLHLKRFHEDLYLLSLRLVNDRRTIIGCKSQFNTMMLA